MKHNQKIICLLLAVLLCCALPAVSCTPTAPGTDGETNTAPGHATVAETDTEGAVTNPTGESETETDEGTSETVTEGDNTMTHQIDARYFVFRVWNFQVMPYASFVKTVDKAVEDGFNAIKIHMPWTVLQPDADTYSYEAFDRMVEYVVREKGLKVAISIDLTRKLNDTLVGEEHIQRDYAGNLCVGGAGSNDRTVISFCSGYAVNLAVDFYKKAVEHFDKTFGDGVLFYLPAFNPYVETEYWASGKYDYSRPARMAFTGYLMNKFDTVEDLNAHLGTSYGDYDEVEPPDCRDTDALGLLWYRFRHERLKNVIDKLAMAQQEVAPGTAFAVQFGSVFDNASIARATIGFTDLCEHADVLWVDDAPTYDHAWSLDYIRSALPATVKLGQEIDGPYQTDATPENYLDQGLVSFERGATFVSIANWSVDDPHYKEYEHVWREISSTWLTADAPDILPFTADSPTFDVSLMSVFEKRTMKSQIEKHARMRKGNLFVYIRVTDDLTHE